MIPPRPYIGNDVDLPLSVVIFQAINYLLRQVGRIDVVDPHEEQQYDEHNHARDARELKRVEIAE